MSAFDVNDAEPAGGQSDLAINEETVIIWTPMPLDCGHGPEQVLVDVTNLTSYPAQADFPFNEWTKDLTHPRSK